jgi:hypothetical protein
MQVINMPEIMKHLISQRNLWLWDGDYEATENPFFAKNDTFQFKSAHDGYRGLPEV